MKKSILHIVRNKFGELRGETLVETLAAIVVCTIAILILATATGTVLTLNTATQTHNQSFTQQQTAAETFTGGQLGTVTFSNGSWSATLSVDYSGGKDITSYKLVTS